MANFLPLTHIVKAERAIMIEGASLLDVSGHLAWLGAMTAFCLVVASVLFRWHKR
jgi:ABC-type polysaccharide/polyol phosphate export permease